MRTKNTLIALGKQLLKNKRMSFVYMVSVFILVSGCGPTYVGVRTSADIPLQSAAPSIPFTNESRGLGSMIGFVFDQSISDKFSIVIEPGISTSFTDTYEMTESGFPGALSIKTTHDYSFAQAPLIFRFSAPIEGTSLRPYFGIGGRVAFGLSGSLNAQGFYLDSNLTRVPMINLSRNYGEVSSIDGVLCAGVDMKLSDSWLVRFDSRLQRSLGDAYTIYTYSYTPISRRDVFITSPITHLSLSFSMLLRL